MARGLSPFLDWMQREIGALHGDVIDGLCGGGASRAIGEGSKARALRL